jgi:hypothetical protein
MMSCEEVRPKLGEFLVGALEGAASAEVERHLEVCHGCSAELAELQRLEGILWGIEPGRGRGGRRGWLFAAAALVIFAGLSALWHGHHESARLFYGRIRAEAKVFQGHAALPYRQPLLVREPCLIELAGGTKVHCEEGSRLELLSERELKLLAGESFFQVRGGGPFVVETPLGVASVPGTSFSVQVREETQMSGNTLVKGSAITVVAVAVVTGAVIWRSQDGAHQARIEAGREGIARKGSFSLSEFGPEVVRKLRDENETLKQEKEGLEKEKGDLAAQVATLGSRLQEIQDKAEAASKASQKAGARALSFGKWGEIPEMADAKWKEAGEAADNLTGLIKDLVAKMKEGGSPSPEDMAAMGRENLKLAKIAINLGGKLPTHSPGNGEYTHPFVSWNVMAEELEFAGVPLTEEQLARMAKLGDEYDRGWDKLQRSYSAETLKLEKLVDELDLKRGYNDRLEALLTNEQREVVIDPETHNVSQIDIHSPVLILTLLASPLAQSSKEEIRKSAVKYWSDRWGIEPAQIESGGQLVDGWMGEVDPRLTPIPAGQAGFFNIDDALVSGRAQVRLMKGLLSSLPLDEAGRKKLIENPTFLVPRLIANNTEKK